MRSGRLTLACLFSLIATALFAHPMGNSSVNHYTRIEPGRDVVYVTYVLDLAEVPTSELLKRWGMGQGVRQPDIAKRAVTEAREWIDRLEFRWKGQHLKPAVKGVELAVSRGSGGMLTLRVTSRLTLPAKGGRLDFEDRNFPDRAGWKEIVIGGVEGVRPVRASPSGVDVSNELTSYPANPGLSPPQALRGSVEWDVAGPPARRSRPGFSP